MGFRWDEMVEIPGMFESGLQAFEKYEKKY